MAAVNTALTAAASRFASGFGAPFAVAIVEALRVGSSCA
jgi:hypothetical protein